MKDIPDLRSGGRDLDLRDLSDRLRDEAQEVPADVVPTEATRRTQSIAA